ncbi:hypothetical protein [Enterococcus sp. AZ196]|uniref:hypothetical protein n=1 Tax=Enterococcus sp. AZ196 TaxID=2774659 RepID=UPI003D270F85
MKRSSGNRKPHVAMFKLLEGDRAGECVPFIRRSKDGKDGWQEQAAAKDWFIPDDQMRVWVELGCIEKAS